MSLKAPSFFDEEIDKEKQKYYEKQKEILESFLFDGLVELGYKGDKTNAIDIQLFMEDNNIEYYTYYDNEFNCHIVVVKCLPRKYIKSLPFRINVTFNCLESEDEE